MPASFSRRRASTPALLDVRAVPQRTFSSSAVGMAYGAPGWLRPATVPYLAELDQRPGRLPPVEGQAERPAHPRVVERLLVVVERDGQDARPRALLEDQLVPPAPASGWPGRGAASRPRSPPPPARPGTRPPAPPRPRCTARGSRRGRAAPSRSSPGSSCRARASPARTRPSLKGPVPMTFFLCQWGMPARGSRPCRRSSRARPGTSASLARRA